MSHTSSTSTHEQFWLSRKLSSGLKDNLDLDRTAEAETELTERARRGEKEECGSVDGLNFCLVSKARRLSDAKLLVTVRTFDT